MREVLTHPEKYALSQPQIGEECTCEIANNAIDCPVHGRHPIADPEQPSEDKEVEVSKIVKDYFGSDYEYENDTTTFSRLKKFAKHILSESHKRIEELEKQGDYLRKRLTAAYNDCRAMQSRIIEGRERELQFIIESLFECIILGDHEGISKLKKQYHQMHKKTRIQ
jgi:hypothetical protein